MKKLTLIVLGVLLAGHSFAVMLSAGTSELKVEGVLDFNTADETLIDFEVFYGQFVVDYIEAGVGFGFRDSDSLTMWQVGVGGELNFDLGTGVVPYLGIGLAYASYEVEASTPMGEVDEDNDAFILNGSAGSKFFIAENIALSGELSLEWATEDIYAEDEDFEDTNASLQLGMRFFF